MSLSIAPKDTASLDMEKQISVQFSDSQCNPPMISQFKTDFQLENKQTVLFQSSMVAESSNFGKASHFTENPFRDILVQNSIKKTDKERVIERVFVLDSYQQKVTFTDTYSFLEDVWSPEQLHQQQEQKPQIEQSTEIPNSRLQDIKLSYQTMIDVMNKRMSNQDQREQELQSLLDEQISQCNAQRVTINQMKIVQHDTEQQLILFKNLNDQLRQQLQQLLDQNNNNQNNILNNPNEDKHDTYPNDSFNNNNFRGFPDQNINHSYDLGIGSLNNQPNTQNNILENGMNDGESTNFTSDILQDFNQINQNNTFIVSSRPIIINLEEESESQFDLQTKEKNDPKKSRNIAKNILTAFRSFFNNLAEKSTIQGVLVENSTCDSATTAESLRKQLNTIFQTNNINNKLLIYLIQHSQFSSVFQFFLNHRALQWIQGSKLSDKEAHLESLDLIKETLLSSGDLSSIKVSQLRKKRKILPVSAPAF